MDTKDITVASLRPLIVPFSLLLAIIVFSFLTIRWGITSVFSQRDEIRKAALEENSLLSKVEILRQVNSELIPQTDLTVSALPSQNPALAAISQAKLLAAASGLTLGNFAIGDEFQTSEGLSKVDVSFESLGETKSIMSFINDIKTTAPLVSLERVKINELGGGVGRVDVRLVVYWADFPEKIPSIESPISGLTQEEKVTVLELVSLRTPAFTNLVAEPPSSRPDPFNY